MADKNQNGRTPDEKADLAIKAMVGTVVGTAFIPVKIPFALSAPAIGAGVVAIGLCYGQNLSKEEAGKLSLRFVKASTIWLSGTWGIQQVFTMFVGATGVGLPIAMALDAVVSGAFTYAIGVTSKAYFKAASNNKELSNKEIGKVFKQSFKEAKTELKKQRAHQKLTN